MKYCKKCLIPDTRPNIVFNDDGVCSPCLMAEKRKKIDWNEREKELEKLCSKYRRERGDNKYDCIIAVSGGKDSYFQVDTLKNKFNMNPLLVSVDNFSWTETGRKNFTNIREIFNCDCISLNLNPSVAKKMFRKALEKYGTPTYYWDRAVYTYPIKMAINFNLPLIFYGENVNYEYGGFQVEETPSAKNQYENDVAKTININIWTFDNDIQKEHLNWLSYPSVKEMEEAKVNPIYLSYYTGWSGYRNMKVAKKFGFKDLIDTKEWIREGYVEQYDQIDAIGYLVHCWMKYPKFGHARSTDVVSIWIRENRINREEGIMLIEKNDYKLDPKVKTDFCEFVGYTEKEFDSIINKWYNVNLFKKNRNGEWEPKFKVGEGLI